MEHKTLTNEKIRKKFTNQFDLVNYAIKLAENMIMSGREGRVKIDSQSRASQILAEIINDKDQLDDLTDYFDDEPVVVKPVHKEVIIEEAEEVLTGKKKSRKVALAD